MGGGRGSCTLFRCRSVVRGGRGGGARGERRGHIVEVGDGEGDGAGCGVGAVGGLDGKRVTGGGLVVERLAVGERHGAGRRVDREAAAVVVGEGIGERADGIGVGGGGGIE